MEFCVFFYLCVGTRQRIFISRQICANPDKIWTSIQTHLYTPSKLQLWKEIRHNLASSPQVTRKHTVGYIHIATEKKYLEKKLVTFGHTYVTTPSNLSKLWKIKSVHSSGFRESLWRYKYINQQSRMLRLK